MKNFEGKKCKVHYTHAVLPKFSRTFNVNSLLVRVSHTLSTKVPHVPGPVCFCGEGSAEIMVQSRLCLSVSNWLNLMVFKQKQKQRRLVLAPTGVRRAQTVSRFDGSCVHNGNQSSVYAGGAPRLHLIECACRARSGARLHQPRTAVRR